MADIDVLPPRGVPALALVDSTGIATNGSQTVAQLAARGIRSICAVDATGISVGGATVAQLASAGIRSFCPVDENGVSQAGPTADALRRAGIRPMVLLGSNGLALTGSATVLTLAQRGLTYFCPLDESGNATAMGAVILVSNTSVLESATVGTTVGTLSVAGGTGTYTFTLTNTAGGKFTTAGTNGVNLNTAAALDYETATSHTITVSATNGGAPITRTIVIAVINVVDQPPVNTVLPVISGSTQVGSILGTTDGTWTGPSLTYSYQWKRGGVAISGATANSYTLVTADLGAMISVTVTATNTDGTVAATATAVGPVAAAGVAPSAPVLAMDPAWTSADSTPDFRIGFDVNIVVNDTIELQIQAAGGAWSPLASDTNHTVTAAELAAGVVNLGLAPLSNANYEARCNITHAGGTSAWSNVVSFTIAAAADVTAPVLTLPVFSSVTTISATIGVTTDEGNGTLWWVASTSATPPSVAQIKAGLSSTGSAAAASGSQLITSTGAKTANVVGLVPATSYYGYFVHTDVWGNNSLVAATSVFTTGAVNAPRQWVGGIEYVASGGTRQFAGSTAYIVEVT